MRTLPDKNKYCQQSLNEHKFLRNFWAIIFLRDIMLREQLISFVQMSESQTSVLVWKADKSSLSKFQFSLRGEVNNFLVSNTWIYCQTI